LFLLYHDFYRYGCAVATAFVHGMLSSEPSDLSLLFFLWYLHSGGGKKKDVFEKGGFKSKKTGERPQWNELN
jgi:hypothetical protein